MNNNLLTEKVFAETIASHGGRVFRVGGCVRDTFMGIIPKDIDFCIVGMVKKNFKTLFPEAEECGKSFPVFRLSIDGVKCEFAFARTERKVGSGYKGFKVSCSPKVTIEDDLFRRDTTVNSIAVDCLTGEVIDPFHGIQDIKDKILRATSAHFSDDPMRALRLAGQSARLGFQIDPATLELAQAVSVELAEEPVERMLIELTKVLGQAQEPSKFFKVLAEANLLQVTFKEIGELSVEKFTTAMVKIDRVAKITKDMKLRFATLGIVLDAVSLASWNARMTLPWEWLDSATRVGKGMNGLQIPSGENIVDVINSLRRGSLCVAEFDIIAKGAEMNVPLLSPLQEVMTLLPKERPPSTLQGKKIGEWFRCKYIAVIDKEIRNSKINNSGYKSDI